LGHDTARPAVAPYLGQPNETTFTSRSCHDLAALRASLGQYDSVFFGPVFPSISKPGYGPTTSEIGEALGAMLHFRMAEERRTAVIAIGGVDVATAPQALALGFDGIAVLGAVWQAADPVVAFRGLQAIVVEPDVPIELSTHSQISAMRTLRSP
jgi:thiamine-phosphate pyrophosphorylase